MLGWPTAATPGFMHERYVDDPTLCVVAQQWEYCRLLARPGAPALPGYREPARIDVDVHLEEVGVETVRELAAALTEAAALLEAHEGVSLGGLERSAFELGLDAQAGGLPATNGNGR